jgi:hypothetical protein
MLIVNMLSVVMVSVIMLSVVAPEGLPFSQLKHGVGFFAHGRLPRKMVVTAPTTIFCKNGCSGFQRKF